MDSSQNNPFGSLSSGGAGPSGFSAPVSNGAGDDIILSGSTQKKTNKKLIIGIVAGVVLLIGAVVGFLMMRGNSDGLGASGTSKEKFNHYANYVLNFQDSDNKLEGEYNENGIYAILEIKKGKNDLNVMMLDSSGNEDSYIINSTVFFNRAEALWGDFYESLDKGNSDIMNVVNEYRDNYKLFKSMVMADDSNNYGEAFYKAEEMNKDVFGDWILSRYGSFVDSNDGLVREYGEKAIQYYSLYKDNYPEIENAECVASDDKTVTCANNNYTDVVNKILSLQDELVKMKNNTRENVVSMLWSIADKLDGKNQNG